ncbi:AbrB/MazE/SpoVT family DNA-binding domain-containing protein [Salipaludibacillus daqingensis]|uniref:AbrB/MazE/SpoVT family DNA-binding domain-containing protein n=1 Tax=Salipaludibacillus daqingensis TaxID=3041001 RepID=UPI002476BD4A|nr:AbrB/MazE/SpoVT family DNA-binding domain-containing protein [Salipaludibacillus daqingensis]
MNGVIKRSIYDTKRVCKFKKDQTILVPAGIRKLVSFFPRDEVFVRFDEKSNDITIYRSDTQTVENRMLITQNGAVRIPSEIKNLVKLKEGDRLSIFVDNEFNGVILKKNHLAYERREEVGNSPDDL